MTPINEMAQIRTMDLPEHHKLGSRTRSVSAGLVGGIDVSLDTSDMAVPPPSGKLIKYKKPSSTSAHIPPTDIGSSSRGASSPPETTLTPRLGSPAPLHGLCSPRQHELNQDTTYPTKSSPPESPRHLPHPPATLPIESPENAWTLAEWPSHPRHPRNWTRGRKWRITITVAFTGFISTLGSSIAVPGVHAIMADFGVENAKVGTLITTFYVLGMG